MLNNHRATDGASIEGFVMSISGVWAVGGSRSLSRSGQAVAQYVVSELLTSGERLAVGCCLGADAAVIGAAVHDGHARRLQIFSVFGPLAVSRGAVAAAGVCASSAVGTVAAAVDLGASITPWAGGGPDLHIKARLRNRTGRVARAATAGGVIVADREFGPGSLLLAAQLAAHGCPTYAVTLAALVPAPGPGAWVSGYFLGLPCWRLPASTPAALAIAA